MAGLLPSVYSGSTALYPVQRSWTADTFIHKSQAGTEQRFKRRGALAGFTLTYTNISTADKNKLDIFVAAQKGAFDATWAMELNANPLPVNGHFQQGLTGWLFYNNDATNAFVQPYVVPNTIDASESSAIYFYNNAFLLQPSQIVTGLFRTTTPIPCAAGETLYVTWVSGIAANSSFPTSIALNVQCEVNITDALGNYLQGGVVANGAGSIPITSANAANAQLNFLFNAQNPTTTTIYAPADCFGFGLSSVRSVVTGSAGVYANCGFDQDEIAWTQTKDFADRWTGTIKVRQTVPTSPTGNALVVPAYPTNGDFAMGIKGWTTSSDPNAFLFGVGTTYTRLGENDAYALNNQLVVAPGQRYLLNFASSFIPVSLNQQTQLSFWTNIGTNTSMPAGVSIGFDNVIIFIYGTSTQTPLAIYETGYSRSSLTSLHGWIQGIINYTGTTAGMYQIQITFAASLYNSTGVTYTVAANAGVVVLGNVSLVSGIGAQFPNVRPGIVTGFPYTPAYRFFTDRNDLPAGPRISYAWYGSGLSNFPNRALRGWGLSFNQASDAELATIESFFLFCGGKYAKFSFTDPDTGVYYPNVRFDMDALDITHRQVNSNEFKVTLAEVWSAN